MEKLARCAKILYDKDIINKSKENEELKKQLEAKNPKIIFPDRETYDETIKDMMKNIKSCVNEWILDEYEFMTKLYGERYADLTPRQHINIAISIEKEFRKLTHNDTYSYVTGENIVGNISPILFFISKIGSFKNLSKYDVAELVYNIVEYYLIGKLDEGCGLIEDISYHNCKKCEKETEICSDLCINCEDLVKE